MKLFTVSAIIGTKIKSIKGKMTTIPDVVGIISGMANCKEFARMHTEDGHQVSTIRKWRGKG